MTGMEAKRARPSPFVLLLDTHRSVVRPTENLPCRQDPDNDRDNHSQDDPISHFERAAESENENQSWDDYNDQRSGLILSPF